MQDECQVRELIWLSFLKLKSTKTNRRNNGRKQMEINCSGYRIIHNH